MNYQPCRWYDPYPRLAFALKLLYFAPAKEQEAVAEQINQYLDKLLGRFSTMPASHKKQLRWYDRDRETQLVVERLKSLPDTMKNTVASRVIEALTHPGKSLPGSQSRLMLNP